MKYRGTTVKDKAGEAWKVTVVAYFLVLRGGTEANHENFSQVS